MAFAPAPDYFAAGGKGVTLAVIDADEIGRAPDTEFSQGLSKAGGNYGPTIAHLARVHATPGLKEAQQIIYCEKSDQPGEQRITETGASALVLIRRDEETGKITVTIPKSRSTLQSITVKNMEAIVSRLQQSGHNVAWESREVLVQDLAKYHGFACGTGSAATRLGTVLLPTKGVTSIDLAPTPNSPEDDFMTLLSTQLDAVRKGVWDPIAVTKKMENGATQITMHGGPTALIITRRYESGHKSEYKGECMSEYDGPDIDI
jgi:branched-subunit amino acid aminotransferase/4-amino-4-deoxychorismate lyase